MRECRRIDGILLLDKPQGVTSNRALQEAKRWFRACKAGHTGSLDPIATGLLPLCFGEATKLSQFLLDADKTYWVRAKLGETTATYDSEGEVLERREVAVDRGRLEQALEPFRGVIAQVPPMYSAVKQGGQPLYKQARAGVTVERAPRQVTVHSLALLAFEDDCLELEMRVSKGTYVRTLVHDLGQVLGCGAHVTGLRRTGIGDFTLDQAVTLERLKTAAPEDLPALLLPADAALARLPAIRLSRQAADRLSLGQTVFVGEGPAVGLARLYRVDGQFLGIGEIDVGGRVVPRRLRATP